MAQPSKEKQLAEEEAAAHFKERQQELREEKRRVQEEQKRLQEEQKREEKKRLREEQKAAEKLARGEPLKPKSVRGAPQSLERYSTASPEEVADMMGSVLKWYGRSPIKTNTELINRLNEFFGSVAETGEIPSVEKMCLALGITTATYKNWCNGVGVDQTRKEIIEQAKQALAALDAELVNHNKIPQVTYIFRAKNFFDMADKSEVVLTPNPAIGADIQEDELRRRITENVIIDADFTDT